jgi:hypothetical protein
MWKIVQLVIERFEIRLVMSLDSKYWSFCLQSIEQCMSLWYYKREIVHQQQSLSGILTE